jgi:thiol-disulfide isomerase/thioredoxin
MWVRALVLGMLVACGATPASAPASGAPLPPLSFQTLGGTPWSTRDTAGKVVVLDVWATYCAPCRKAFPKLDRLAASHPDVAVVGISVDEDDEVVRQYLTTVTASFLIVRDPQRTVEARPLAVHALPTVIVLDRRGRVRFRADEMGEDGYDELPALVASLLAEVD